MSFDLSDKRVIVTGGARGIGEAVVRALAAAGARVVSFDVLDGAGREVAAEASSSSDGDVRYDHLDITDRGEVMRAVQGAATHLGGVDALLNIAGIERRVALEDMSEAALDEVLAVNVKGTVFMCQAVFGAMRERGGCIMNVGSGAGLKPYPKGAHYSASKGAVMAFTRTAAHEWGRYGIRVNSLVPAIRTPMADAHFERLSPAEQSAQQQRHAATIALGGRLGDPDTDLAPVVLFLVSDASKFITGQIIAVNGGLESVR